jgi:serine phosphatase RsbU (regulator of sigma subunit)
MKLRTRLVLALFLLAVVPLTGASLYAYLTSERAFRLVVAAEASGLARELGGRMDEVENELRQRFERMRNRQITPGSAPFAQARRDALAAAEREQLREVLRSVLGDVPRGEGEIPFAVDDQGHVLAADEREAKRLEDVSLVALLESGRPTFQLGGFVVAAQRDADSGYSFGIARPVGEAVAQIRSTAVRNLGLGLGLVALALLGILPFSRRITRDLEALEAGAERLAGGDLDARVEVRSRDEIGRLAFAFNRMARDLALEQERRLAEEGLRRELITCRRIQTELLPHGPLETPLGRTSGVSFPAREVGGDFFNYFLLPAGELALLVGDVSGKGIAAALLMANAQAMLRGSIPLAWDLASLATRMDDDLHARTPPEAYLTLFFGVVDPSDRVLRYVNGGHNPPLLLRRGGTITRLDSTGRPLGLLPGGGYEEGRQSLEPGDALVLFTDGVLDMENERGEVFGEERLETLLRQQESGRGADDLVACLADALQHWRGTREPPDDATLVVLKVAES